MLKSKMLRLSWKNFLATDSRERGGGGGGS